MIRAPFPASYSASLGFGLTLTLLLTVWAFAPGLGGVLIFDDIPNLLPWQDLGDIDTLQEVMTFVSSGTGLPGRPLSLFTFLIDDQSWTPDVQALKRTNLAIHLINSCLIFWLCLKIASQLMTDASVLRQGVLALLATAIWSLHPLQVSNVSYVIQRMNLLSTALILAGLLLYIHGRAHLVSRPVRALVSCSLAIGLFMPLAILAKENGLLLCAFALLVERFCFSPQYPAYWRWWKLLFLWLPLLAFLTYCLVTFRGFTIDYPARNFNSWERLLTQGHVLTDYIGQLLLPRLHDSSLYYDNYPVSRSLFQPITTLFCWMGIVAAIAVAWRLRNRIPMASFGIFFYFTGHLMESTLIPLELYFEHRNYLPQLGLWLALAGFINQVKSGRLIKIIGASALAAVLLLTLMTRHHAESWGKPMWQAAIWYQDNPGSLRTTLTYANMLLEQGDVSKAKEVLDRSLRIMPNSLVLTVSQRYINCYWQGMPTRFDDLPQRARTADHEYASIIMLKRMQETSRETPGLIGDCQPATETEISKIYSGILENPRFKDPGNTRGRLFEYLAEIAVNQRQLGHAMTYYDQAFINSQNPIYPYRQAQLLVSAGLPEQAAGFVAAARNALTLKRQAQYPDLNERLDDLEHSLARGATKQGAPR